MWFRVDWGNLQIPIGYPWHWHPWVDWDPGGLGQDWDNGYPLDIHGIGIPG